MLPLVYFFSITFLYTDNFFPALVFVTSFTSIMLLQPTRPPNPKRTTGFYWFTIKPFVVESFYSTFHQQTPNRLLARSHFTQGRVNFVCLRTELVVPESSPRQQPRQTPHIQQSRSLPSAWS
ncbi:hypothetical protein K443DRAFT_325710 [Laccaria amethystina LaAM-08-1]|uniref:Uncharacterized protein n=1 Tax=Laccaria amethystina LaAM-08-1 TaxID=1095629 RepID=A0A0C9X0X9_9AGAR|nr:hypothetical protein K443DRAFT_325710 [Laccaria amethystina LaAM-08-1]